VYYPSGPGAAPGIIFSHGLGGAGRRTTLPRVWAQAGFVVIVPLHSDSLLAQGSDLAAGSVANSVRLLESLRTVASNRSLCLDRLLDLRFILDRLTDLTGSELAHCNLADPNRVGIAGFSLGAFVAQLLCGVRPTAASWPWLPERLPEPRIAAAVLLGSQGIGRFGLGHGSWQRLTLPMLSVAESGDGTDWRMDAFRRSPPGDKYHLALHHAAHLTLGGILRNRDLHGSGDGLEGTLQRRHLGCLQQVTVAFWRAYLRKDHGALERLRSELSKRDVPATARLLAR
jgi:dienelactone hydrolase